MFVLFAIIGLSILIFFHELGHFIVAKISGIKVEEFGIGYPPRFFGFVKVGGKRKMFFGKNEPRESKNTIYSLNWIPFGGFNKLKGELEKDQDPDSFRGAKWWKKFLVAVAGVAMNIIVAILIFFILYSTGIPQDVDNVSENAHVVEKIGVQVGSVVPDSPAQKQGLIMGDIIKTIDGKHFDEVEDFQNYTATKKGESIELGLQKNGRMVKKNIPVKSYDEVYSDISEIYKIDEADKKRGVIGAGLSKTALVKYPFHSAFLRALKHVFGLAWQICAGIVLMISSLITKGAAIGGVMGPVGITKITAGIAEIGFLYLVQFLGLLSVAIAVFQLIPFPALDGSRALFALIEGIKGKPIKYKTENIIVSTGFLILITILGFVTIKEVIGLF